MKSNLNFRGISSKLYFTVPSEYEYVHKSTSKEILINRNSEWRKKTFYNLKKLTSDYKELNKTMKT